MDKNQFIQEIYEDIISIEPDLKKEEERVKKMIGELIGLEPNIVIDEKFKNDLRALILDRAKDFKKADDKIYLFTNIFKHMDYKTYYLIGGALIGILLFLPVSYLLFSSQTATDSIVQKIAPKEESMNLALDSGFKAQISKLADSAFGKISGQQSQKSGLGGGGGSAGTSMSAPASAPIATEARDSAAVNSAKSESASIESAKRIAMPEDFTTYRYVYKGDPIEIKEDKMDVYKRVKGETVAPELSSVIGSVNSSLLDWNKFNNSRFQSVGLVQDKEFGYNVYVSYDESSISINENWLKWPHPENQCKDEACFNSYRLKISDMPDNEIVLKLAAEFAADYKVNLENFGEPEVADDWRIGYANTRDKANYYFPDTISVVYPVKINGQLAYNDGGGKAGMNVSVNLRSKKVNGLWELTLPRYESSAYEIEKDSAKIIKVAERGGLYGYTAEGGKIVEIELGTPQLALMKTWQYKDNLSNELYVPAYVFPIVKVPEGAQIWQKAIVVPIAKDILDEAEKNIPSPTPLMEKSAR